jgi:hypothetical protein
VTGGVSLGETHSLGGKTVNVRRLVETAAETPHITPPQIVDQKENNVWRLIVGMLTLARVIDRL